MMDLFLSTISFSLPRIITINVLMEPSSTQELHNHSLPIITSVNLCICLSEYTSLINSSIHWPVSESILWNPVSGAASLESQSNSVLWFCSHSFTKHHTSNHPQQCSWVLQMLQYKGCSDYLPRHHHWPQFCWIGRTPRREKGYYRPDEMSGF